METDRSRSNKGAQHVAAAGDAGVEGGKGGAVLTAMPVLLEQAEPSWRCAFLSALF